MREQKVLGQAPIYPDLEAQAWDWLRLLTSGDARELDARRFRRWVKSSPSHRAAYTEARRRWDAIEPATREVLRLNPEALTPRERPAPTPVAGRRAFLAAAMSATAVVGVAVVHPPLGLWPAPDEWDADDRTATGEQRTLALADSVNVTLNTRTSVRRETQVGKRTVELYLITGEAAVDMKEGAAAFTVVAGNGRSVAASGSFQVRYLDGIVCVTCIEGAVRVEHPLGVRQLTARQQAIYGSSAVSGVGAIDPETVSAWREGMLVFNQAKLSDALEEINRYRAGRVVLMNAAVGSKPVSGRFAIASLDLALWQLQEAFGLHARSLPGGLLVLS